MGHATHPLIQVSVAFVRSRFLARGGETSMTSRSERSIEDVDAALAAACSRRTLAVQHREKALAAIREADNELLICERHMEMCDRSISGLLDERIRCIAEQAEKVATG